MFQFTVWYNGEVLFDGTMEECEGIIKQMIECDKFYGRHRTYHIR